MHLISMNGSIVKASLRIVCLIVMPAPRRSAPRRTQPTSQGLLAKANIPTPAGSIFTQSAPVEQPMLVNAPGAIMDQSNRALLKFSQLIMMGIALTAIWGGLFSIAFAEGATNNDFLIIFIGGLISAAITLGWIEVQSRKNDHVLYEVQDYMLGIGFFFATIGMIWGTRWLIGVVTGEGWTELFGLAEQYNAGVIIDPKTNEIEEHGQKSTKNYRFGSFPLIFCVILYGFVWNF